MGAALVQGRWCRDASRLLVAACVLAGLALGLRESPADMLLPTPTLHNTAAQRLRHARQLCHRQRAHGADQPRCAGCCSCWRRLGPRACALHRRWTACLRMWWPHHTLPALPLPPPPPNGRLLCRARADLALPPAHARLHGQRQPPAQQAGCQAAPHICRRLAGAVSAWWAPAPLRPTPSAAGSRPAHLHSCTAALSRPPAFSSGRLRAPPSLLLPAPSSSLLLPAPSLLPPRQRHACLSANRQRFASLTRMCCHHQTLALLSSHPLPSKQTRGPLACTTRLHQLRGSSRWCSTEEQRPSCHLCTPAPSSSIFTQPICPFPIGLTTNDACPSWAALGRPSAPLSRPSLSHSQLAAPATAFLSVHENE